MNGRRGVRGVRGGRGGRGGRREGEGRRVEEEGGRKTSFFFSSLPLLPPTLFSLSPPSHPLSSPLPSSRSLSSSPLPPGGRDGEGGKAGGRRDEGKKGERGGRVGGKERRERRKGGREGREESKWEVVNTVVHSRTILSLHVVTLIIIHCMAKLIFPCSLVKSEDGQEVS